MRSDRPRRARGTDAGERASAGVEFALVLPLVLIMTLALLQVALLAKDQLVLMGAARAGARQGAVSTDDASVHQAVVDEAASLDPARIEVVVERDGGIGLPVRVTARYQAPIAISLVRWLFPNDVGLSGTASMRQETG
jgi:hypothetical protein